MAFYILVGIAVLVGAWGFARSRVMRAWLRGRSSDPSHSTVSRLDEMYRTATWRQDE